MKKLNNKGITTIELIICFILVITITTSMYATVASFNQKRILEQYKEEIYTYKNLLTKEIQNDFIKVGLTDVKYKTETAAGGAKVTYTVDCGMKDGTKRKLIVIRQLGYSPEYHASGSTSLDDYYMIKYGDPDGEGIIDYPIPEFGSSKNDYGKTIQDLSINYVHFELSTENVFTMYIGFYHPELGTRYGIKIVIPVNYVASGKDAASKLNLYDPVAAATYTPSSFATDSWKTIIRAVRDRNTAAYHVGDVKTVNMGDESHVVRIANMSTPEACYEEGFSQTACGFVIEFTGIVSMQKMNSPASNAGGWSNSDANSYVNSVIYSALPEDLQDGIIPTQVVSSVGKNDTIEVDSGMSYLYLLTPREIFNSNYSFDTAGSKTRQLDYYNQNNASGNKAIAIKKDFYGVARDYWTRTANKNTTNNFYVVLSDGSQGGGLGNGSGALGISPAFRIG